MKVWSWSARYTCVFIRKADSVKLVSEDIANKVQKQVEIAKLRLGSVQ